MNHFQRFLNTELDDFIQLENKEIENTVIDYILEVKQRYNPNTVPTMITPVKAFLEMNDVILNWKKLVRFFPDKIKKSGQSAWTTEDVQKMLMHARKMSTKAMIHVFASTGCRVGGVVDLKIKNVTNMPYGCKMVMVYADDKDEYPTFLTPEASFAYDEHIKSRMDRGENLTADSYVFSKKNGKPTDPRSIYNIMKYVVTNANLRGDILTGTRGGARYRTQLLHGFRKRFNTVMKLNNDVNDNAIEKMMGHKNGLDGTYLQIEPKTLFENFMKGVFDLTVSEEHRLKCETNELKREKTELNEKVDKLFEVLKDSGGGKWND